MVELLRVNADMPFLSGNTTNMKQIGPHYLKTGRNRAIISAITPVVDAGVYPVKRTEGDWLTVQADVFTDGHDQVRPILLIKEKGGRKWHEIKMNVLDGDRWHAVYPCAKTGEFVYRVKAMVDHALTWQHAFRKRLPESDEKELLVQVSIAIGLIERIGKMYPRARTQANKWIALLHGPKAFEYAAGTELEAFFMSWPLDEFTTDSGADLPLVVHRKRAGFSAWYSFFPRSAAKPGSSHGTFADCEELLPRIKELGFDVVYFPPIHPIGQAFRKGKNNSLNVLPDEPGCPYATGSAEGGHKSVHAELGTINDFKQFIQAAKGIGIEVAMDFAIQCSPDHPYLTDYPQWFKWRPDGTVQYAENPPKKYQDVLPLDFENEDWQSMWIELRSILEYWIEQGIRIFRVDNPHTKSFVFWQWCLAEIDRHYPEVIFLSEAFTRPRIMEDLAKKGYHQSYTYFTWRNSKWELIQYMEELTQSPMKEYFRPNFWTNTHDIHPYILQSGHEPQFLIRFFLAASLSSNYGIFGPVFEMMVKDALPGKEEYLNSEKYEVRHWDWAHRNKLMHVIARMNEIRNANEALQFTANYSTVHADNDQIMAYLKTFGNSRLLCVVNLDAWNRQKATLSVPLDRIGLHEGQAYTVHDLFTGEKYSWNGSRNYVELDPYRLPFHLFRIENA
jgi:starch synthase (maltosyl-transferring)